MPIKPYSIQLTATDPIDAPRLTRVDYDALCMTLRFPVIWVYEHFLQAWLPREVDHGFIRQLVNYRPGDERLERRIEQLGLFEEEPVTRWEDAKAAFERDGYTVVKRMFHPGLCKQLADYYYRQPELHDRWKDMPGIKRTSVNNSPLMRLVHQSSERFAKYVIGDIKTSYSFTSAYEAGTILPRHTDRPQCVFNASVILGIDPSNADPKAWPLHIEIDGREHLAHLNVGDAVFYSGVKDPHWREELPSNVHMLLGTFFHFVRADWTGSLD